MQNFHFETWQALLIGFIIGAIFVYVALRFTQSSKKQAAIEAELKQAKNQLSEQQAHLEAHFAQSAEMFKTLIVDYQKLYRHYANSADKLLNKPDQKGLFTEQLINAKVDNDPNSPPRDYSEGSSGLFNEK